MAATSLTGWVRGLFQTSLPDQPLVLPGEDAPLEPPPRSTCEILEDVVVSDYVAITLSDSFCDFMLSQASGYRRELRFDTLDMKKRAVKGVVMSVKRDDGTVGTVLELLSVKKTTMGARAHTYTIFSNEIEKIRICHDT